MKKLIIHCGFHKTASSSIQETLRSNQKLLEQNSLEYVNIRETNGRLWTNHSIPIFSLFCDKPSNYPQNIIRKRDAALANNFCKHQLSQLSSTELTYIISGESISTLSEAGLLRLKKFFEDYHVRVICYIRDPYQFTCSSIQERVKSGEAVLNNIEIRPRSTIVKKLKNTFPETEFYSFDDACRYKGGPIFHFLGLLEIKNPKDFTVKKTNEGLSNQLTRLLNHINEKNLTSVSGIKQAIRLPQNIEFGRDKFLLTDSELALIKPQLLKEYQALNQLTKLIFNCNFISIVQQPLTHTETKLLINNTKHLRSRVKHYIWNYIELNGQVNPQDRFIYFNPLTSAIQKVKFCILGLIYFAKAIKKQL